jgi:hypothetical protein
MRWARHVTCMGEITNACRISFSKSEKKRALGIPRYIWKDTIKTELGFALWTGFNWFRIGCSWRLVWLYDAYF